MKNEIEVRTNKGEYSPGEHICGAVYLRIISPTAGSGVQIKFHGCAKFEYLYTNKVDRPGYKDQKDCINYPYEKLFQSEEPLSIGNKLFPFKIELSRDIPGTFETEGFNRDAKWKATVEYVLEVEVINAKELKKALPIVILQQPGREVDMSADPRAVAVQFEITRFLLLTDVISITARLHNHIHRTGEVIKLRVIITNNSRTAVQSLRIKLLRKIILMCKQPVLPEYANDQNVDGSENALDICVARDVIVGMEQIVMLKTQTTGVRHKLIWSTFCDKGYCNYSKFRPPYLILKAVCKVELDSILFPLKEADGRPVCPTTRCACIECGYRVCVTADLSNGSSFDTFIPVPVINAERSRLWKNWEAPFWLTEDDMEKVPSDDKCLFAVSDNILCTEAFSSIPGFQPL